MAEGAQNVEQPPQPQQQPAQQVIVQMLRAPQLPESFGDGDFQLWIKRFDICAKANRWNDEEKLLRLPLLLKGRAFAVYERNINAEVTVYADLVKAIKQSFAPDTEESRRLARRQLQDRKLQEGEDLEVFLRSLERLLDRAAPDLPAPLRSRELVDHFIEGLPASIAEQLYILAPATLPETVTKARELTLLEKRRGLRSRRIAGIAACADDGDEDEGSGTAVLRAVKALTSRLEKLESRSQSVQPEQKFSQTSPGERNAKIGPCFGCGQYGHLRQSCPNPSPGVVGKFGKAIGPCFACGGYGHFARHCANKRSESSAPCSLQQAPKRGDEKQMATCSVSGKAFSDPSSLLMSVLIAQNEYQCLIDTGASVSVLPVHWLTNGPQLSVEDAPAGLKLKNVDGSQISVRGYVVVTLRIGGWTHGSVATIARRSSYKCSTSLTSMPSQ